jgi:diacylglycerol kinase family enzyme
VGAGGRAFLTITVAEADRILSERKRAVAEIGLLPGWSAAHVARALGIRQATVYRLRELGTLPAAHEVQAIGRRKW